MNKTIQPHSLSGSVRAIPSKSVSHRAVLYAALAQGPTELSPMQLSEDIRATLSGCQQLGLTQGITLMEEETPGFVRARVLGRAEPSPNRTGRVLDCGESGSTLRFLLPLALDGRGPVRFIGHGRLMQRPLGPYEDLFAGLGVRWERRGEELTVDGQLAPGTYALPGNVSSQFVSGLLFALPFLAGDSRIELTSPLESRDYVELTRDAGAAFGIRSAWAEDGNVLLIPGRQKARGAGKLAIEGDWSHAAFYLVAGLLGEAAVRVTGLNPESRQADRAILDILRAMGGRIEHNEDAFTAYPSRLTAITADCAQCPDLVPILAVAMAGATGQSRITGAARLRIKESDRLRAVRDALNAIDAVCEETEDGLLLRGRFTFAGGDVRGCGDHRIVMAMAVASIRCREPLVITDAECVAKSAPAFWEEFKALGGNAA